MPGQVVVGTISLLVYCQHLGIYYNLRQLGAARFCLRSPVMGQLTSPDASRTRRCQSKHQNNPHSPWLITGSPRSEVRTDAQDAADGWNHRISSAGISAHTSNGNDLIVVFARQLQTRLRLPKSNRGENVSDHFVSSSKHNSCGYWISPYARSCSAKKTKQKKTSPPKKFWSRGFLYALRLACESCKILVRYLNKQRHPVSPVNDF